MNIAFWVLAAVLALAFLGSGAVKLLRTREQVIALGYGWAGDFPSAMIKLIAVAEIAGAIGLIVPPALDIVPLLSPVAAASLSMLMVGALVVHARRRELGRAGVPIALLVLSALLAAIRFVWCPF